MSTDIYKCGCCGFQSPNMDDFVSYKTFDNGIYCSSECEMESEVAAIEREQYDALWYEF